MARGKVDRIYPKEKKEGEKTGPQPAIPVNAGKCPACGRPVVWVVCDGQVIPCDPKRRLVVFCEEKKRLAIFQGKAEGDILSVFAEASGNIVWGRAANEEEREKYVKTGNPGVPFEIGRRGHWTNTCDQLLKYLNGEVSVPKVESLEM